MVRPSWLGSRWCGWGLTGIDSVATWDTRLDRQVAIKVLPPISTVDGAGRERFEAEARAISRLAHPRSSTPYEDAAVYGLGHGVSTAGSVSGATSQHTILHHTV